MAVQTVSRRRFITAAALLLGGAALIAFVRSQDEPPPASWVRDELWGDHLLAYVVRDGVPSAVLSGEVGRDDRVNYDQMIRGDWFWPTWPSRPQWQLMGLGYSIARSDALATVGYAPCVGILGERCRQPRNCSARSTTRASSPWRSRSAMRGAALPWPLPASRSAWKG